MREIRVALAEQPDELRRLVVREMAGQADLTIAAVASSEIGLLLEAARADAVVVAMRWGEPPAMAARLLDEYPRVGVVCVDEVSGLGEIYRLNLSRLAFGLVPPGSIATAIRTAVDDSTGGES